MDQRLPTPTYREISSYLKNLEPSDLQAIVNNASHLKRGNGGEVFRTEINKVSVIIKKIPYTEIEQNHPESTSNLFNLPLYYHYGVDSTGFGCREVPSHELTTAWVLSGECENFPLMYHRTIIEHSAKKTENKDKYVEYWNGSAAIGKRIDALEQATSAIVIFMEDFSQNIDAYFEEEFNRQSLDEDKINTIIHEASQVAHFMKSRGFLHFDLNPFNMFFHRGHFYLADFGLAISSMFELDEGERPFFDKHVDYDRSYLAITVAGQLLYATKKDRSIRIGGKYLRGEDISDLVHPVVASYATKHQRIAMIMDAFFESMKDNSKNASFPADQLRQEWSSI